MTESNLPAIPDKQPAREIATTDTDSWVQVARPILALAEQIADTEFVPRGLRGSVPATAAAMLYGREVGLPPMTALNVTHVIEGKPGISAEAMRALVYAAGHQMEFLDTTGAVCTMRARRSNQERWTTLTWTIDMARAAGLLNKSNWKSYPRALLVARCTTDLCRMVFPDVIHGFRTVEELEDLDVEPEAEQPQSGTKVTRARRTAKKSAAAPAPQLESAVRPEAPAGPPLPGEEGFEPTEQPVGGEGSSEGEASEPEPPTGDDAPATNGDETGSGETEGGSPDPEATEHRPPRKASRPQVRMIEATLSDIGVDADREERHLIAGAFAGRAVTSMSDLTAGDASKIIDGLAMVKDKAALNELLDTLDGPE